MAGQNMVENGISVGKMQRIITCAVDVQCDSKKVYNW